MFCTVSPNLKAGEGPVSSAEQDEVRTNGMVLTHYVVYANLYKWITKELKHKIIRGSTIL